MDNLLAETEISIVETFLAQLDKLKASWLSVQPLNGEDERRLKQKLRLEWNYNSNHIEGNTLTYGETELLLIQGQTVGGHTIREYEEMKALFACRRVSAMALDTMTFDEEYDNAR
jgi:Fic family protein